MKLPLQGEYSSTWIVKFADSYFASVYIATPHKLIQFPFVSASSVHSSSVITVCHGTCSQFCHKLHAWDLPWSPWQSWGQSWRCEWFEDPKICTSFSFKSLSMKQQIKCYGFLISAVGFQVKRMRFLPIADSSVWLEELAMYESVITSIEWNATGIFKPASFGTDDSQELSHWISGCNDRCNQQHQYSLCHLHHSIKAISICCFSVPPSPLHHKSYQKHTHTHTILMPTSNDWVLQLY